MAASQPTSPGVLPPPDIPFLTKESPPLVEYLRRFSLWSRQRLDTKVDARTALDGVLLQAFDAPPGTTPAVWRLRVTTNGVLQTISVPLGPK